jgi:hypothetical protein
MCRVPNSSEKLVPFISEIYNLGLIYKRLAAALKYPSVGLSLRFSLLRFVHVGSQREVAASIVPIYCLPLGGLKPSPLGDGFSTRAVALWYTEMHK